MTRRTLNQDGLAIVWSRVNQAWFVLWNDRVLRVFGMHGDPKRDREEAMAYVQELREGPRHVEPVAGFQMAGRVVDVSDLPLYTPRPRWTKDGEGES